MEEIEKKKNKPFWLAGEEIQELVAELYVEHRKDLEGMPNIICVFREKALYAAGKITMASIKKVTEKENIVHSYYPEHQYIDYALEIAADIWPGLTEIQKEAILLHEIHHIDQTNGKAGITWNIKKHGLEEFSEVIKVYGLYMSDIKHFADETKGAENIKPRARVVRPERQRVGERDSE